MIHDIDALADFVRGWDRIRQAIQKSAKHLPEVPIPMFFLNCVDGPQFFRCVGPQALYYTPAYEGQTPLAWRSPSGDVVATLETLHLYSDAIDWLPLYPARRVP